MSAVARALALLLLLAGCGGESGPTQPNLLLLTVDTLRADRLACYGGPAEVGRAICALAEHGTRFEWAFSTAPYTAPSIASVLTSRYPAYHGVTQSALSFLEADAVTVAELLREAGYRTAAFISNPVLDRRRSLDQGFDFYDQRMNRRERNRPGYTERDGETTTEAALAWARIAARGPWFLWVHYQDPHGPYDPPDASVERDRPGEPRLPLLKDHTGLEGIPAYQALPGLQTPGAYQRRYLDEIRYLDAHLARLVRGLDALGAAPAVLLTADHGEAFGEDDFYFAHGHSVGLDQIRVPLLWRPPRPAEPTVVRRAVGLVDVAPTLLHVAGVPLPEPFQGQPLPVAGVETAPREDEPIFAEHGRHVAVIHDGAYYARNRRWEDEGVDDPKRGKKQPNLPHRTARLRASPDAGEGGVPAYAPAAGSGHEEPLEPLLAEFLEATRGRQGVRYPPEEVPEETLEQLEALGYTEDG